MYQADAANTSLGMMGFYAAQCDMMHEGPILKKTEGTKYQVDLTTTKIPAPWDSFDPDTNVKHCGLLVVLRSVQRMSRL